ncbi:MAG: hypothetical protein N2508_07995 [Anaerolineae bacterium]|nr:hypothetical protein [Anaerolineae bacterium]
MDPETVAVIGLCVVLTLWYAGGYLYNRRQGEQLFRWLRAGLDVLGGEKQASWLGSPANGVYINITHAAPPFRRLEIALQLENREILPLWLFERLRGRRDRLIIKATLRSPVHGEVEIVPARGRTARLLRREQEQPWSWQAGPHHLLIGHRGSGAQRRLARLVPWVSTYGMSLQRFSWRKDDPHVQLQMKVTDLLTTSSEAFLTALQIAVKEAVSDAGTYRP